MLDSCPTDLQLVSWCASVSSLLGSPGHGVPLDGCTQRKLFPFFAPRFGNFVCGGMVCNLFLSAILLHIHAGMILMQLAFLFCLGSMACLMQVSCQSIWPANADNGVNLLQ